MEYRTLGKTDIKVSAICLGTMTWGQQNSSEDAFAQMDYALAQGLNFFDTAELYPVPPSASTYAGTEKIIGDWLKQRNNRDKVILATKIAGPGPKYIRGGSQFSKDHLHKALDASLERLCTDYIDLYQLHWPERNTNCFGKLGYLPSDNESFTPFEDILETLGEFVKAGKIRCFGVSNETPWGVMQFLNVQSAEHPRVMSIQNPYSLLNRSFEVGLAEIAHREQVGLLAYSPLGFGVLSGKYLHGQKPKDGRLTLFPSYSRYTNAQAIAATQAYVDLAQANHISAVQMSLQFVTSRPFVTSNIIGATTLEQLKENIDSINVKLSPEILNEINAIHNQHPNPAP